MNKPVPQDTRLQGRLPCSVWSILGILFGLFILGLIVRALYLAFAYGDSTRWGGETVGFLFVWVLEEGNITLLFVILPALLLISLVAYLSSIMKRRSK